MLSFKDVYISDYYTLVGPVEKESDLKNVNMHLDDYYFEEKRIDFIENGG